MYLKRLEMYGFKSFADKTKLDFEKGITAIIGPNGCGKSNTSDAIRWCLGETSARSLRSHQMMDVVFGGSQSRQTTGMAEVSLTFDNSQNVLPIDYSEITVTRRLFRSGESEYFINKTQCRLKDIRDLFLDTGIGSEGYSIIEQGKVEFLLTARPEERREMFEEAAGVSKYKVRREETLRKLEKVEIDMNRINDMLALLKEQITSLDAAARKARQYQKNKEDLKRLEIAALVQHIRYGAGEIQKLQERLAPRLTEFETMNTSFDQTEASLQEMRLEQIKKDETYVSLQDEFSQIKSSINVADERIQQAARREAELMERQVTLASDADLGEDRIRQLEAEESQLGTLIDELTDKVASLEKEFREREGKLQDARNRIAACQDASGGIKNRIFALEQDKTQHHNRRMQLQSRQAHCTATRESLQRELDKLNDQFRSASEDAAARENEMEAMRRNVADLNARVKAAGDEIASLEEQHAARVVRQGELKEKTVSLSSRIGMLKEWENSDPLRTTMRSVLSLDLPGMRGPLSGLLRIDPGMEETVAAALGEKLNYMVADSIEPVQKAISHLEDNNLGRLTFIVMDRLPENHPVSSIAHAAGTRELISLIQYDAFLAPLVRHLCGGTLVDGQTIYGYALVQGGGRISFDTPVLFEEQLRRLSGEHEEAARELADVTSAIATLEQKLSALRQEHKTVDYTAREAGLKCSLLEENLSGVRKELEYREKEISLTRGDIQARDQEGASICRELEDLEKSLASLAGEEQTLRGQMEQLEREQAGFREEEASVSQLVTDSRVAWSTQSNELAGRERERMSMTENASGLRRQIEQHRQEMSSIETRLEELKALQVTESGNLRELHLRQTQKETEVQLIMNERQEFARNLETRAMSIHELRQKVETLKQEIHDVQMEQRSYELQKQNMEQRLREDYAFSYDEVKDEYASVSVNDEEIGRLKRRIESMGAVNLAAPEEYTNLEERYNFLLTQQQDLLKAKEDLHHVIGKINQTTRENFRKTFDQVREHFRTIYHQLFTGGEADLILTDESNLLECGVDIFAQPPGKKLQNITLLSGGEKALTAIALLFSFFLVRPSPFCILDEVDAPLDDANIGRYIGMIREFAARSQFLVITHNKRTMEMADILYGVTMEELGVSKIISVRLNKENNLAETA